MTAPGVARTKARQQSRTFRQRVVTRLHHHLPEAAASLYAGAKHCWQKNAFHLRVAIARRLSNARVALPLDRCYFARRNIDLERSVAADPGSLSLDGNLVVSGRHGNPKTTLVISRE
jgi:hypothetical protein